jgi:hypothetical protein
MKQSAMDKIKIQESLEHRILHGLSCEWENALWLLPHSDRDRMKRPFFALKDMTRRLGSWTGEKNELALSRSLVLNCSWDDVRQVLFHEMAHQYADQILGAAAAPCHGPAFKKACRLLRASAKASAAFRPLHETLRNSEIHENDRILIRIKKLMSLAESQNPHEAEAAMTKAHVLIKKYNIDLMRETSHRDFVSIFVGTPALRHHREVYHLANLLQSFYFVHGLWVSAYVVEKGKMGRVFEISGTVSNVNIASYVHDVVTATIHTQWHRYNASKRLNRYRKTDFAVGIIKGFCNKLEAGKETAGPAGPTRALIKTEDPLLKAYMAYKYPNTRSFQRAAARQDDTVLKDGYGIGKKLLISKGITHRQTSGIQLPHFRERSD